MHESPDGQASTQRKWFIETPTFWVQMLLIAIINTIGRRIIAESTWIVSAIFGLGLGILMGWLFVRYTPIQGVTREELRSRRRLLDAVFAFTLVVLLSSILGLIADQLFNSIAMGIPFIGASLIISRVVMFRRLASSQ